MTAQRDQWRDLANTLTSLDEPHRSIHIYKLSPQELLGLFRYLGPQRHYYRSLIAPVFSRLLECVADELFTDQETELVMELAQREPLVRVLLGKGSDKIYIRLPHGDIAASRVLLITSSDYFSATLSKAVIDEDWGPLGVAEGKDAPLVDLNCLGPEGREGISPADWKDILTWLTKRRLPSLKGMSDDQFTRDFIPRMQRFRRHLSKCNDLIEKALIDQISTETLPQLTEIALALNLRALLASCVNAINQDRSQSCWLYARPQEKLEIRIIRDPIPSHIQRSLNHLIVQTTALSFATMQAVDAPHARARAAIQQCSEHIERLGRTALRVSGTALKVAQCAYRAARTGFSVTGGILVWMCVLVWIRGVDRFDLAAIKRIVGPVFAFLCGSTQMTRELYAWQDQCSLDNRTAWWPPVVSKPRIDPSEPGVSLAGYVSYGMALLGVLMSCYIIHLTYIVAPVLIGDGRDKVRSFAKRVANWARKPLGLRGQSEEAKAFEAAAAGLPQMLPLINHLALYPQKGSQVRQLDLSHCSDLEDAHLWMLAYLFPKLQGLTLGIDHRVSSRGFAALRLFRDMKRLTVDIKPAEGSREKIRQIWKGFSALNPLNMRRHVINRPALTLHLKIRSEWPFWRFSNPTMQTLTTRRFLAIPRQAAFFANLDPATPLTVKMEYPLSLSRAYECFVHTTLIPRWCSHVSVLNIPIVTNWHPIIARCAQLHKLTLGMRIFNRELSEVSRLPALRHLRIEDARDTLDSGLSILAHRCPSLESLQLCGTHEVTDVGIHSLASLSCLRHLAMGGVNAHITDASITELMALPQQMQMTLVSLRAVTTPVLARCMQVVSPETRAMMRQLKPILYTNPDEGKYCRRLFQREVGLAKRGLHTALKILLRNRWMLELPCPDFSDSLPVIPLEPTIARLRTDALRRLQLEPKGLNGAVVRLTLEQLRRLACDAAEMNPKRLYTYLSHAPLDAVEFEYLERLLSEETGTGVGPNDNSAPDPAFLRHTSELNLSLLESLKGLAFLDYRTFLAQSYPHMDLNIVDRLLAALEDDLANIARQKSAEFRQCASIAPYGVYHHDRHRYLSVFQDPLWKGAFDRFFDGIGDQPWAEEEKLAVALCALTLLPKTVARLANPEGKQDRLRRQDNSDKHR